MESRREQMNTQNTATRIRIEEIIGLLNAYHRGWLTYDSAHVLQLQRERRELELAELAA
jgi:hypothetical protein